MAQYETLKSSIQAVIKQNGNNEITGELLQQSLLAIINSLGAGYQFADIAVPSTNPGTPDQNLFYIAGQSGTYANFGLSVSENEIAIFVYNGLWAKQTVKTEQLFLFAERCPFIKELYLTQAGINAGVYHVHNIKPGGNFGIAFSNEQADTFVARTPYYADMADAMGIMPITPYSGGTTILGYIIVDWTALPDQQFPSVCKITDLAKNIAYSPGIYGYLVENEIESGESLDLTTEIFGANQYPLEIQSLGSTATNTDIIWLLIPVQRLTKINRIKFLGWTGTINFYKVHWDGTNSPTQELIISKTVNVLQRFSIIELFVNVELGADDYIGVNGSFLFKNGTPDSAGKTRTWTLSTGVVSDVANQYLYVNPYYTDVVEQIDELSDFVKNDNNMAVMYSASLNSENADIVGTQNIVDGSLRIGSSILYLNKFYSLGIRKFRAVCKNFTDTTVARFSTVLYSTHGEGGNTNGFDIDFANRTVKCRNLPEIPCVLLVNYSHRFVIDITKHYQDNTIKIVDLDSGAEWSHTWTFNGTGGVGAGAIGVGVDTGMAWDMYAFRATSGQFDIEKIMVFGEKADVIFYGDSITEPEAYWPNFMFPNAWTQIFAKKSRNRIISSGRSGTGIGTLLSRMQSELPGLKPKAVFITIGTNGGINYAAMETLVNYIRSLDIVPYVNHIPANINSGGVSNHAAVNAVVDQIRSGMDVTGIDFDKPTSVDYAGGNVNIATMWMEDYGGETGTVYHHPNELGSAAMVARALVDTPEIFSL